MESKAKKRQKYFNDWLFNTDTYQAGMTFEYVCKKYGFREEDVLRLAGNESTIGSSPYAIEAAQQAITKSNYYGEPKSETLLEALKESFSSDLVDLTGLDFIAGNGMDSIIEMTLTMFCKPGDSILDLTPTFSFYNFAAKRQGVKTINVARVYKKSQGLSSLEIDFDKISESLNKNIKIVFLCSPNNPDGKVTDLEQIKKLADRLLEHNIILFLDHAYIDYCDKDLYDGRKLLSNYENIIIGYTFSKAYALAGFRVGYALMHKTLQERFISQLTPFLISKPSVAAALAALADKIHLQKILDNNSAEKPKVAKALSQLGFEVFTSDANFLLFRPRDVLKKQITQLADFDSFRNLQSFINEKLMSQGIIIRPIKDAGDDTLRVTIGTSQQNQRFLVSLEKVIKNAI